MLSEESDPMIFAYTIYTLKIRLNNQEYTAYTLKLFRKKNIFLKPRGVFSSFVNKVKILSGCTKFSSYVLTKPGKNMCVTNATGRFEIHIEF